MILCLTAGVVQAIMAHARRDHPSEACGLMLGHRHRGLAVVRQVVPMRNMEAPTPKRFLIDPAAHLALARTLRQQGQEDLILGPYHSHPNGRPIPSALDGRSAMTGGELWLIAAPHSTHPGGQVRAWCARGNGRGFWPTPLLTLPAKTLACQKRLQVRFALKTGA